MSDVGANTQADLQTSRKTEPHLYIPISDSNEVVEVPLAKLPQDSNLVTNVLMPELPPLNLWLKFAVEYYKRGQIKNFLAILELAISAEAQQAYKQEEHKAQRVAIINALAAHNIQKFIEARRKKKPEDAKHYESKATEYLNQSNNVAMDEPLAWVAKGLLLLAQNKRKMAEDAFNIAMQADDSKIPHLLAKACARYHDGAYQTALDLYQRALRIYPDCPVPIRYGIGLCFFRLKQFDTAKKAFARCLEKHPDNVDAMVGLATIFLNSISAKSLDELDEEDVANRNQALMLLQRGYSIDPENPCVLNLLADHFFFRDEMEKVGALYKRAIENTGSLDIQAEAQYQLARALHKQGLYDGAESAYFEACKLDPSHVLAKFGHAQIYTKKGQLKEACKLLEEVYAVKTDNFDVFRLLGSLYYKLSKLAKARTLLKRGTSLFPDRLELWVLLAQANESTSPVDAYDAYTKVVDIIVKDGASVPVEIWTNIGVMCHQLGKFPEAERAYVRGLGALNGTNGASTNVATIAGYILRDSSDLKKVEAKPEGAESGALSQWRKQPLLGMSADPPGDLHVPVQHIPLAYNLALLYEHTAETVRARRLYTALVRDHPTYLDSYLRLGCIERDAGKAEVAESWYKKALEIKKNDPKALSVLAELYMSKKDKQKAAKCYNTILKHVDERDLYARLALGNLERRNFKPSADPKQLHANRVKAAQNAARYYRSVLARDEFNIFAANGLASTLVDDGRLKEAKDLLISIREATADVAVVWVNLGHVYTHHELYDSAIKMYQHVIARFNRHLDPTLLLYLGRAFYLNGDMLSAKRTLLKALHLAPSDPALLYNLALSQEEFGVQILSKAKDRTYKEVTRAVTELKHASVIFFRLKSSKNTLHSSIGSVSVSRGQAGKHGVFIRDILLKQAEPHLQHAQQQEEYNIRMKEQSKKAREEAEAELAAAEERKRQSEEAAAQALRERAAEEERRLREMQETWQLDASKRVKEKDEEPNTKRTKEDDEFVAADDAVERELDQAEANAKKEDQEVVSDQDVEDEPEGDEDAPVRKKQKRTKKEDTKKKQRTKAGKVKRKRKAKEEPPARSGKKRLRQKRVADDDDMEADNDDVDTEQKKRAESLEELAKARQAAAAPEEPAEEEEKAEPEADVDADATLEEAADGDDQDAPATTHRRRKRKVMDLDDDDDE